jgi:hypothetical protein
MVHIERSNTIMGSARQAVGAGLLAGAIALAPGRNEKVSPDVAVGPTSTRASSVQPNDALAAVLVTIDGVRWQEIFGGVDARLAEAAHLPRSAGGGPRELVPNIYRLFFEGGTVLGDPRFGDGIRPLGPRFVSLPSYVELMTGARSSCRANGCFPLVDRTIADEIAATPNAVDGSVAIFTSWEQIGRTAAMDRGRVLVRAGREPREEVPSYPGTDAYRADEVTEALAIEHLIAHRPTFLWVALGDTDEFGHRNNYRGYLRALRGADAFIGELAAHLDEMGEYGARTVLIVTTDHGRDPGFADHGGEASGPIWLLARGGPIPKRGVMATREPRRLRDVAPTLRALLGMPTRTCDACGAPMSELLPEEPPADARTAARPRTAATTLER